MTRLSDQVRQAIAELKAQLDEQLDESLRVLLQLANVEASEGGNDDLRAAFLEIDAATSESEVLCRMLEQCSTKAERVGLLLVKSEAFEGWAGIGFDQAAFGDLRIEVRDVEALAQTSAHNVQAPPELREALVTALATTSPLEAVTIPFVLRGRTEALLYADRVSPSSSLVVDDLRILVRLAAQTLELQTLRTASESGQVAQSEAVPQPVQPRQPEPPPARDPLEQQEELRATTEMWFPPSEDEARDGIESVLDAESDDAQPTAANDGEAAVTRELAATTEWRIPGAEGPSVGQSSAPVREEDSPDDGKNGPEAELQASGAESGPAVPALDAEETLEQQEIKTTEAAARAPNAVAAPADLSGPGSAFSTGANAISDIMDQDEQARRLAGFLVSEIKLYNEDLLREARATGGVYAALQEDIELARGIYEERTDAELRGSTAYFDDEILRVLGDGDPSALGR